MNSTVDIKFIAGLAPKIQDYLYTHVLAWSMLPQLAVAGAIYLLAYRTGAAARPWLVGLLKRSPLIENILGHVARVIATRLAGPIFATMLLWLTYRFALHFQWPSEGIHVVLCLSLAWVVVRLLTGQMRNRPLARIISVAIWSIAALEIVSLLSPLLALLNSIDLTISNVHLTLLGLIEGIIIFVALFLLAKKFSVVFEHWIKSVEHLSPSMQVLLDKLFTLSLSSLVIIAALYFMGFNLTVLAVFGGAIGLGIGFGLQKVFSNLISGLIILADKSIKPGDVIQVGDTYGWTNYLGGRYISVVTRDGMEYLIPNEELVTGQVINWSYSNKLLRIKISIGIGYGSDLPQAMQLMLAAAKQAPRVLSDPRPSCLLVGFGDNSVNFQLRVWINDPQNGITNIKSRILLGVWKSFREHGIEIPFPQRVLHHKSMPELSVAFRTPVANEAHGGEADYS